MYYHAPYVKKALDIHDFLRFCEAFVSVTALHHETEETVIFPFWAEMAHPPDLMKANVEEHAAFHGGLDQLKEYSTQTAAENYRWEDLYAILDELGPPLVSHLTHEIDTLLTLRDYPHDKVLQGWREGEKAVGGHASNYEQVPFGLGCNDVTFEGGKHYFPAIPWLLQVMVAWWYGKKYKGAWRFCP